MIDVGGFFRSQTVACEITRTSNRGKSWDDNTETIGVVNALLSKNRESGLNANGDTSSSSFTIRLLFDNNDFKPSGTNTLSSVMLGDTITVMGIQYEIYDIDTRGVLPVIGATCSIRAKRSR